MVWLNTCLGIRSGDKRSLWRLKRKLLGRRPTSPYGRRRVGASLPLNGIAVHRRVGPVRSGCFPLGSVSEPHPGSHSFGTTVPKSEPGMFHGAVQLRPGGSSMANLVRPHGGTSLRPLMPEGEALASARARAGRLPAVPVSSREAGDIVMLGIGGFTPLDGFMGEADWRGVCDEMRTADGLFWPIPITAVGRCRDCRRHRGRRRDRAHRTRRLGSDGDPRGHGEVHHRQGP